MIDAAFAEDVAAADLAFVTAIVVVVVVVDAPDPVHVDVDVQEYVDADVRLAAELRWVSVEVGDVAVVELVVVV